MKLSKQQIKDRDEAFDTIAEKDDLLRAAVREYNRVVSDAFAELEKAKEAYNESVQELTEIVHDIGSALREQVEGKSDAWQESDAGTQAASLAETYENFELEEYDADASEEVEEPGSYEEVQAELADDSGDL